MRHAVIVAHPDADSFNCAVARDYAEAATAFGDEVVVRDLYRMNFDPRLQAREIPWAKDYTLGPDVAAERALLSDVKVFVLVYPLWFNAPPAMLKGYVDRVFGMGFGFQAAPGGSSPALTDRCLVSFTSSGAPKDWVEQTGAVAALRHAFDDHVAAVCGLAVLEHHHFGGVVPGMSHAAVSDRLGQVRAVARRLFAPAVTA